MSRPRHPNPSIEKAVRYAEQLGWRVRMASGHAWGCLYCPRDARDGCRAFVHSTPRVPENHARHLRSVIDLCPHGGENEPGGDDDDPRS